ncbi:baseplate J/gp47 family protein [Phascolarctobacterium faecium]|uniref:baseplate J/gp47 family protein n=1 Tax=Phascolarctobacterium faecium TaxID=33025 RepID=UPI003AB2B239
MSDLVRINYIDKDHDSIVSDVIAQIKAKYPDTWTDFEHDNAGRMLLEVHAYIIDLLLFYLDRQANECFLVTARERQKAINCCKAIGYVLSSAVPSKVTVKITLKYTVPSNVTINAGTELTTSEKIVFELDADVIILAGELNGFGTATQGKTYTEILGISDGSANQSFLISKTGVIDIKQISVGYEKWTEVESFAFASALSKNYTVEIDALGRGKIIFGDNRNGLIPTAGSMVKIVYRVGGGLKGNIVKNTLIKVNGTGYDANGQPVAVTVTNEEAATGGEDEETIAHARKWAPVTYSQQNRLVTEEDYTAAANSFADKGLGRFAKAKAIIHERSGEANVIRIYALCRDADGGFIAPSKALGDAFVSAIDDTKMITDHVEVTAGTYQSVDISGTVKMQPGYLKEEVLANLNENIEILFDMENREMGQSLRISDLYKALDSAPGVDWVELTIPQSTVTPVSEYDLLTLGNVNFEVS